MEGSGVDLGRRLLLNHSDLCLTVAWPGILWHQPVAVPSCPRTLYHAVPTPFTRMPQRQYCQRRQWGIWLSNLFRFFWSWFLDVLWVYVLQDSMELFLPCLWVLLYWYLLFMASLIANHGGNTHLGSTQGSLGLCLLMRAKCQWTAPWGLLCPPEVHVTQTPYRAHPSLLLPAHLYRTCACLAVETPRTTMNVSLWGC